MSGLVAGKAGKNLVAAYMIFHIKPILVKLFTDFIVGRIGQEVVLRVKKDKLTKEILYDPDGKPYIPLKAAISLAWGAIRQLQNVGRIRTACGEELDLIERDLKAEKKGV